MNNQPDDNSSESESEFFVSPNEIDLDSSFFEKKEKKSCVTLRKARTYENSDDSDEFNNVNDSNSVELFSQVLKNLENTQAICSQNENAEKLETVTDALTKQNKSKVVHAEKEKIHLSQHVHELLFEGEGKTFESDGNENYSEDENPNEASSSTNYTTPKEGVKITLPGTGIILKKKRHGPDLNTIIENRINQRLRANQILIHKVGILCWLAHGFHVNKVINDAEIMSASLSLIPVENLPKKRSDLKYLEKFVVWFKKKFVCKNKEEKEESITKEMFLKRLQEKEVLNYKELVFLCIALLRAMGLNCRLIISLHPPPLKLQRNQLFKVNPKEEKDKEKKKSDKPTKKEEENKKEKKTSTQHKVVLKNNETARKNAQLDARKRAAEILNERSTRSKSAKNKKTNTSNETIDTNNIKETKNSNSKQNETQKSINTDKTISNTVSKQLKLRKQMKTSSENNSLESTSKRKENVTTRSSSNRQKNKTVEEDSLEELDDSSENNESEEELPRLKKRNISKTKNDVKLIVKKQKKINKLSSDDEVSDLNNAKNYKNFWLEIYLESEENWISVNIMDEKVHCVEELYKAASSPVLYVIAWNIDGTLKDVTRRYCPHWLTVTRKQRIDEDWFSDTLRFWKEKKSTISTAEDKLLAQKELEQPLPKTIGECKNHPLYVLTRHLLKYEALYPPDCVPLGYLQNGEAIYSRHCLHVLSSRETWIKKARVVKPNQEPYKIVKALPKYDKLSGVKLVDRALELFGEWQTTEYIPPEAKDGIVPRNEYGNVDLFKKSMLPKGTVYIDLPGLNRIARKLNIDCASAVIGFKFGSMGAVPAFEGFVVCTEYEDILREAWETEQIEAAKRAREKRYKRIYGNWKRLIDGMRIKEKLAGKYKFESEKKSLTMIKRTKQKITDVKRQKMEDFS
ncbi:DNA repair protein complementing XP-C cells homolog isoform X1 [Vespula pensylvanica]|uniref:DNA repair protein complementing XP-C cells homolog isoform X1 n=1 Tax=Vespula pensylvanica TaxID=30213 RepID=UPI001CBA5322|nr:DNA repair protein complementing XP-C cells homolog isoform X1 [Vespula pensylvanica]